MIFRHPDCFFLVQGHAEGTTPLNAFDAALINAGVGDTNLVRLSSILPPHCEKIDPIKLPYGALIPIAYSKILGRGGAVISAAVAVAVPTDPELPGLIMEYNAPASLEDVQAQVKQMAISGMALRNREIKEILITGATLTPENDGCCFAGVVLWTLRPPGL